MVEFGEQLRKVREERGMTQQSLAEQLYVTRQSVSRWECGDRYPDLVTTKKISQILEVSLDDLLSGKEMMKVVERNSVIENKTINNIMIALYACVVFSLVATIIDIIIRFPLQSEYIDYSGIELIVINVLGLVLQAVFFAYGFVHTLRGSLLPKRMGIVIAVFFAAMCITGSTHIPEAATWQILALIIILIIPSAIGAVASILFFSRKNYKSLPVLVYLSSIFEIGRIIFSTIMTACYVGQFFTMNNTIGMLLKVFIYALIIYQTNVLCKKRANAVALEEQ